MAKNITVVQYSSEYEEKWDMFVEQSANGTFLQSRRFLEYHPQERFQDNSLLFVNGNNIVAVLPANVICGKKKVLCSHQGSTFGGIVIAKQYLKITYLDIIFEKLDEYLKDNRFDEIVLKHAGRIYLEDDSELLDYYYFLNGYSVSKEVGYYIDYNNYNDDVISNFTSSRRRDFRYSLKNDLSFVKLNSEKEIKEFYAVLCDNYKKFNKLPVHTVEELLDFRFSRLIENVDFYGVYFEEELIAGGMVFKFNKQVFHTQYLAVKQNKTDFFANDFMYKSLIDTARNEGFQYLSFGTSTFEGGKVLNRPLAQYKEGFGTQEYVNRTYLKNFN